MSKLLITRAIVAQGHLCRRGPVPGNLGGVRSVVILWGDVEVSFRPKSSYAAFLYC